MKLTEDKIIKMELTREKVLMIINLMNDTIDTTNFNNEEELIQIVDYLTGLVIEKEEHDEDPEEGHEWCVVDAETQKWTCERCGLTEPLPKMPIDVLKFVKIGDTFVLKHRDCKEKAT
jgi:hypothetical protein